MAPPELAADAPVLNVIHPLVVRLGPVLGHEADAAVFHRFRRGLGERGDAHVPLIGEPGFEHGAAAIAARNLQFVRLDLFDQTLCFQFGDDFLAGFEAIQSAIGRGHVVVQCCIRIEHIDQRKIVPLADLVVVEVVSRCDFHAAGTEGRIDVRVRNDRDLTIAQR